MVKLRKFNTLKSTLINSWGLLFSILFVSALLLVRVNSHKYSFDTTTVFLVLHSILFDHSTLVSLMGLGWVNYFNIHFNSFYILISPLYFLGPTILIFCWKFFCYGGFLVILWRLIDSDRRYDI